MQPKEGAGNMSGKRSKTANVKVRFQTDSGVGEIVASDEKREFYSVQQIASLLQLDEMTIYRMVKRGDLASYAIGRIKRFRSRDLEAFLEGSRVPARRA